MKNWKVLRYSGFLSWLKITFWSLSQFHWSSLRRVIKTKQEKYNVFSQQPCLIFSLLLLRMPQYARDTNRKYKVQ